MRHTEHRECAEASAATKTQPSASLRPGIGWRLLTAILLFSSAVTLLLTLLQLYFDYRTDLRALQTQFDEIEKSYLRSLSGSLWTLDTEQINLQLEGIKALPDIQFVEVLEATAAQNCRSVASVGQRGDKAILIREFPLIYRQMPDPPSTVGTLYVEASLRGIYNRLLDWAVYILISQGVKTFLVSLFTLFIVHRLITRHLVSIAEFLSHYDLQGESAMLVLERRPLRRADELDGMTTAFNAMSARLRKFHDELRQAEEDLWRYKDHLEDEIQQRTTDLILARNASDAANRAKSVFLAHMSHELRTPLTGILGYTQLLQRDQSLNQRQLDALNVIRQSSDHLLTLINDILDFARIEAGKQELNPNSIHLARFLRTITDIIRVKAQEKGLVLICDTAPDLPEAVRADENRLRQVLLNLFANAVKFTHCGYVRLHVRFLPPTRLRFDVEDSGIGINDDQLESIFEPFEQVGEARNRLGGSGLGLAISRHIVRLMGGEIQVRSQIGAGSTFWFELELPEAMMIETTAARSGGYDRVYEEPLFVPALQEMEVLHHLALQGNMRDISQWATRLLAQDERYRPFADKLQLLAKGYQSKAILSFVALHMEQKQTP